MGTDKVRDPTVSIIVPTYNRRDRLKRLLRSLEREHGAGAHFEVVVTVDGATDGTAEMLAALRTSYPLRAVIQPNSGRAAARNRAISAAMGDVLLCLDDDVIPVDGLVARHLEVHRRDPHAAVIGMFVAPPGAKMAPWLRWEAQILQRQFEALRAGRLTPTARQFYTGNASARREDALAVGGFDESLPRAEDVEFGYRLADRGVRFYFVPEATVLHEWDRTFRSWLRVPYEYGRQTVRVNQEKGAQQVHRVVADRYRGRHRLSRLLVRSCLGHPVRCGAARYAQAIAGYLAGACRAERLSRAAYSGLAALAYFQGCADMLGGSAHFWRAVQGGDASAVTIPEPVRSSGI